MHEFAFVARLFFAIAVLTWPLAAQRAEVRVGPGGEVIATLREVAPGSVGVESELKGQSFTVKTEAAIELGKAKVGVWSVRYQLSDDRALVQLLLLEQKDKVWQVTDIGSSPLKALPPRFRSPFEKLWKRIDGELLLAALKRAGPDLVQSLGTQLPVVIIACGASFELPFLVVVCEGELVGVAGAIAKDLLTALLEEAGARKILTTEEVKELRLALAMSDLLKAILQKSGKVEVLLTALELGLEWADADERTRFGAAVAGGTVKKARMIRKVRQ